MEYYNEVREVIKLMEKYTNIPLLSRRQKIITRLTALTYHCIATGRTEEETIQRMKEAIKFHIEGLQEEKTSIPAPSTKAVSVDVAV